MSTSGTPRPTKDQSPWVFGVTFIVLVLLAVGLVSHPYIDEHYVTPLNDHLATASGFLINLFGGGAQVSGRILSFADGKGAVAIASGCNGVEVCLMLAAAMLAFPAPLMARIGGVFVCIIIIQAVNLARIISLLYLDRYAPHLFEFFHNYLWDAVILLDAILLFFLWLRHFGGLTAPTPPAPPAPPTPA